MVGFDRNGRSCRVKSVVYVVFMIYISMCVQDDGALEQIEPHEGIKHVRIMREMEDFQSFIPPN